MTADVPSYSVQTAAASRPFGPKNRPRNVPVASERIPYVGAVLTHVDPAKAVPVMVEVKLTSFHGVIPSDQGSPKVMLIKLPVTVRAPKSAVKVALPERYS